MSAVKIRCKCEWGGVEYNGVVLLPGVNMIADLESEVRTVGFDVPSPLLLVDACTSVSLGDGIPSGWLVLNTPADPDVE